MKIAVDLHIHSALSPCSSDDMTPNNIVNIACLKGLDAIAVTDHNSAWNLKAVMLCAEKKGILAIPGMEIETREEVHVIGLFPELEAALEMQRIVYDALPELENREDIFGRQLIMDEDDNITGICKRMLLTATRLSLEEVFECILRLNGAAIPAHIDREAYSIVSNLGMIPENLKVGCVEISKSCNTGVFGKDSAMSGHYKTIISSDAHSLESILEREFFIEVEKLGREEIISKLKLRCDLSGTT